MDEKQPSLIEKIKKHTMETKKPYYCWREVETRSGWRNDYLGSDCVTEYFSRAKRLSTRKETAAYIKLRHKVGEPEFVIQSWQ